MGGGGRSRLPRGCRVALWGRPGSHRAAGCRRGEEGSSGGGRPLQVTRRRQRAQLAPAACNPGPLPSTGRVRAGVQLPDLAGQNPKRITGLPGLVTPSSSQVKSGTIRGQEMAEHRVMLAWPGTGAGADPAAAARADPLRTPVHEDHTRPHPRRWLVCRPATTGQGAPHRRPASRGQPARPDVRAGPAAHPRLGRCLPGCPAWPQSPYCTKGNTQGKRPASGKKIPRLSGNLWPPERWRERARPSSWV